jgi:hypothetical protein
MRKSKSKPAPALAAPLVEYGGDTDSPVQVLLHEAREYIAGTGPGMDFQIVTAITGARYFAIERGSAHCLLIPLETLTLNGRELNHPVLLANGDEIHVGGTVFNYACPEDGNFPYYRISDTFWVLREVPEGWQPSPDGGIFRRLEDNFVENVFFNQDEAPQGGLEKYLEEQFRYMSILNDDFSTKPLPTKPFYRSDVNALHLHEFTVQGKLVGQYQYFALKNEALGIASWTLPVSQARGQSATDRLFSLLGNAWFC